MGILAAYAVPHPPLIVPAVGRGEEAKIQATVDAYREIARRTVAHEPDTIIVSSPHAPLFRDFFHVTTKPKLIGSMAQFRARKERMTVETDRELARRIVELAQEDHLRILDSKDYDDGMDHATYVPLFFLREAYRAAGKLHGKEIPARIVRIGLSGLSFETHRAFGRCIARAVNESGKRVVYIASGDLSHKLKADGPYGFAPEGPVFDKMIGELFAAGDLEGLFEFDPDFTDAAAECGLRSFQIMAGALEETTYASELLSLEGPFGVGYGVGAFEVRDGHELGEGLDASAGAEEAESADGPSEATDSSDGPSATTPADSPDPDFGDAYVCLAREVVETYVRERRPCDLPAWLPPEMRSERAGVFVSLHEHGELRGCIGTIAPTRSSIADEIVSNGIAACSRDPRFPAVTPAELPHLDYSVDVLMPAEPITSLSELDPKRYGVIVSKGWQRGLLLPDLEGVDTVEEQVRIATLKAGLHPGMRGLKFERFEVVRHAQRDDGSASS